MDLQKVDETDSQHMTPCEPAHCNQQLQTSNLAASCKASWAKCPASQSSARLRRRLFKHKSLRRSYGRLLLGKYAPSNESNDLWSNDLHPETTEFPKASSVVEANHSALPNHSSNTSRSRAADHVSNLLASLEKERQCMRLADGPSQLSTVEHEMAMKGSHAPQCSPSSVLDSKDLSKQLERALKKVECLKRSISESDCIQVELQSRCLVSEMQLESAQLKLQDAQEQFQHAMLQSHQAGLAAAAYNLMNLHSTEYPSLGQLADQTTFDQLGAEHWMLRAGEAQQSTAGDMDAMPVFTVRSIEASPPQPMGLVVAEDRLSFDMPSRQSCQPQLQMQMCTADSEGESVEMSMIQHGTVTITSTMAKQLVAKPMPPDCCLNKDVTIKALQEELKKMQDKMEELMVAAAVSSGADHRRIQILSRKLEQLGFPVEEESHIIAEKQGMFLNRQGEDSQEVIGEDDFNFLQDDDSGSHSNSSGASSAKKKMFLGALDDLWGMVHSAWEQSGIADPTSQTCSRLSSRSGSLVQAHSCTGYSSKEQDGGGQVVAGGHWHASAGRNERLAARLRDDLEATEKVVQILQQKVDAAKLEVEASKREMTVLAQAAEKERCKARKREAMDHKLIKWLAGLVMQSGGQQEQSAPQGRGMEVENDSAQESQRLLSARALLELAQQGTAGSDLLRSLGISSSSSSSRRNSEEQLRAEIAAGDLATELDTSGSGTVGLSEKGLSNKHDCALIPCSAKNKVEPSYVLQDSCCVKADVEPSCFRHHTEALIHTNDHPTPRLSELNQELCERVQMLQQRLQSAEDKSKDLEDLVELLKNESAAAEVAMKEALRLATEQERKCKVYRARAEEAEKKLKVTEGLLGHAVDRAKRVGMVVAPPDAWYTTAERHLNAASKTLQHCQVAVSSPPAQTSS